MRILFPYMARWKSVNWTRYHSLFDELSGLGHEIYILQSPSLDSNETNYQEIDINIRKNIHIIDVDVPRWLWNTKVPFDKLWKKGIYSLWCGKKVKCLIEELSIDLLLVYNIPQYFLSRTKQCQVVFDVADDYIPMLAQELGRLSNRLTLRLAEWVFDRMVDNSDVILTVSNVLSEDLSVESHVVPNGVSPEKAMNLNADIWTNSSERRVVGFIGSFEYFIDFDIIVAAAEQLPHVDFLLVGSGREYKSLEEQISVKGLKNIHLTGGVPHGDVFSYIDKMDICLNIFKQIRISHAACPIKLFEYMVLGKPVISTCLEELEILDLEPVTFADSANDIVISIRKLLNDENLRTRLGEQSRNLVMDQYTWRRSAEKFVDIVESNPTTYQPLT